MTEVSCYNKGCGKKYNPTENNDGICQFHPGVPVFHDALKGWSCCKKRSTDFTEFLNIPGCSKGSHTNVKPVEPEKPKPDPSVGDQKIEVKVRAPLKPKDPSERPSEDEPMVRLKTVVGATLKQALDKQMKDLSINNSKDIKGEGIENQEIKIGTCCKNNACKATYEGEHSNTEDCIQHPGVPIFHEGLKYWSCCQRKTTEFDNFLAQEGCTVAKHLWIKKDDKKKVAACRYDWHQTGQFVTISVFAKVAQPELSWVETNQVATNIHITFDSGNSVFQKQIILKGVVDPEKSSVKLLGTKVEINLRKAEPGSWSVLELMPPKAQTNNDDSDENN